ncbi:NAD(P)H-binding protein [Chelativorans salis]|uniref:NAD(P)H-binding protein n=1 Tax=Chelativorans salis TaxID=2978478 RepID=A0ABT2LTS4_9HYPH|nr:NAD(P)H-binding protein [Chelativorans sp. EGI FJ00035]MCT7377931.1 NAD(P)H-binding protein [Chelativorans sp. EGI FJ00035]
MSIIFHEPILVIGGKGKVGRRVADRLTSRGFNVRVGSRSANPRFDWNDRQTWGAAIDGVQAAYISYYPDLALPGADEAIRAFTSFAVQNGLKRLVLLSGRGEPEAQEAEQVLIASGAEWTVVRPSWFAQNFSENFFLDGILAGEVVFPRDGVLEPFIDAEDIADVVVAALTDDRHIGQLYELTGPRMLTFRQAIAEIAATAGRDIRYIPVSVEDYAVELRKQDNIPAEFVGLLERLTREVLDGRNAYVTDGVQKALGRAPRDFSDYVRATAETGVWRT